MQFYQHRSSLLLIYLLLGLLLNFLPIRVSCGQHANNIHKNVSDLLDNLLKGYDNSLRPDFGGAPTEVEINIMVRSMGPISEVDMSYQMDLYFRQSWVDKRLSYTSSSKTTLALSISMLQRIWKPDTYFYNGKQSYVHTITTPNKFVRLYQDGRVLYSSRLTVKASCPMHLENFPMDTQRCPLKLGSFGYTTRDVIYLWKKGTAKPVDIASDMKMSQFDLISTPSGNVTDTLKSGQYSCLLVNFHLQRHMGNFLIQVYGPCTLLVVLSWVSFWLNRESTADRVSLGVTTVLTMTFLGLEARTDLPKVPYPTALDFFVFYSYAFIFATIIQFAIVHFFTKSGSGEMYFCDSSSSSAASEDSDTDNEGRNENRASTSRMREMSSRFSYNPNSRTPPLSEMTIIELPFPTKVNNTEAEGGSEDESPSILPGCPRRQAQPRLTHRRESLSWRMCAQKVRKKKRKLTLEEKLQLELENVNSVSKVDRFARIFFPLSFLLINIFYWYSYLYKSGEEIKL